MKYCLVKTTETNREFQQISQIIDLFEIGKENILLERIDDILYEGHSESF